MTLFEAIHTIEQSHDLKTIDAALLCNLLNDYQVYAEEPSYQNILKLLVRDQKCFNWLLEARSKNLVTSDDELETYAIRISSERGYDKFVVFCILKDLRNEKETSNFSPHVVEHLHESNEDIPFSIQGVKFSGKGKNINEKLVKKGFVDVYKEKNIDDHIGGCGSRAYSLKGSFMGIPGSLICISADLYFDSITSVKILTPAFQVNKNAWMSTQRAFLIIKNEFKKLYPKHSFLEGSIDNEKMSDKWTDSQGNDASRFQDVEYLFTIKFGAFANLYMCIYYSDEEIWIDCSYYLESDHIVSSIS